MFNGESMADFPEGENDVVGIGNAIVDGLARAGDAYAGGLSYALTRGRGLAACGRVASIAASGVVGHFGAGPEVRPAGLAKAQLK